jgi:hypothetical protein
MTPENLAVAVGIVVALVLQYAPKVKDWYDKLTQSEKKLVAVGIGFVLVVLAFVVGCFDLPVSYWACTTDGGYEALRVWGAYVLANQTTYALAFNRKKLI